ncbi:MAG: hypothetical protein D6732_19815, partial [Methanobacteriota archaeon]
TTRDIYLLEAAANIFNEQREHKLEKEALAHIHLYKEEYQLAGDLFAELSQYEKALKCYWEGGVLDSILQLKNKKASFANRLELLAASCLQNSEPSPSKMLITLHKRIDDITTNRKRWKEVIRKILENLWDRDIDSEEQEDLGEALMALEQVELVKISQRLAKFFHEKLSNNRLASNLLKKLGITAGTASQTLPQWMHEVLATTASWPHQAIHLSILGKTDELIEQYLQNQHLPLTDSTLQYVLKAFLNQYGIKFENIPPNLKEQYFLFLLIDESYQRKEDLAKDIIASLLKYYMDRRLYRAAALLASKLEVKYRNERQFLTAPIDRVWLLQRFIYEIGNSTTIHRTEPRELVSIEEFLNEVTDHLERSEDRKQKTSNRKNREGELYLEDSGILKQLIEREGIAPLGKAFENIGRYKLSKDYYNTVLESQWYRNEKEEWFARKRWAKNTLNYIEHLERYNDFIKARKHEKELEKNLVEWGIEMKEILNEPDLPEWHAYEEHDKEESSEETPVKPRDITAPLATNGTNAQDVKEAHQEKV